MSLLERRSGLGVTGVEGWSYLDREGRSLRGKVICGNVRFGLVRPSFFALE